MVEVSAPFEPTYHALSGPVRRIYRLLGLIGSLLGAEPERLDRRHATGVAATLPLGVPLS